MRENFHSTPVPSFGGNFQGTDIKKEHDNFPEMRNAPMGPRGALWYGLRRIAETGSMAKMRAVDAAVLCWRARNHGTRSACRGPPSIRSTRRWRKNGSIRHILARHVEGASNMADGYSRAKPGNIGVASAPPAGRHRHDHRHLHRGGGLDPHSLHHRPGRAGETPQGRLPGEIDIEKVAGTVAKWAVTVREPAQVAMAFQQAFHVMRSGRPRPVLIDLPFDVQMGEVEFEHRHLRSRCRSNKPPFRAARRNARWRC